MPNIVVRLVYISLERHVFYRTYQSSPTYSKGESPLFLGLRSVCGEESSATYMCIMIPTKTCRQDLGPSRIYSRSAQRVDLKAAHQFAVLCSPGFQERYWTCRHVRIIRDLDTIGK